MANDPKWRQLLRELLRRLIGATDEIVHHVEVWLIQQMPWVWGSGWARI